MPELNCPNCGVTVPGEEIAGGWCEACGKKIPPYALKEAGIEISLPGVTGRGETPEKLRRRRLRDGALRSEGQSVLFAICVGLAFGLKYLLKLDDTTFYLCFIPLTLIVVLFWVILPLFSNRRKPPKSDGENAARRTAP